MSETDVRQKSPEQKVIPDVGKEKQTPLDIARKVGAPIKRHPVRAGILGTAIGVAGWLGIGGSSAEKPTPPSPASAPASPEAQQGTLSTISPEEIADFGKHGTLVNTGDDLIPAGTISDPTAKAAEPAKPSPARELQLCGCGLPAGHGGDHASSSSAHEPDK